MAKPKILECFENPAPGRPYVIEHVSEEFTSVCPKTGHPDFGTVTMRYIPGKLCVELKSLKLYYQAFRNEGIFYEAVTNKICEDLDRVVKPLWMMIETSWSGRGGISSVIRVEVGIPPGMGGEDDFDEEDDGEPLLRPGEEDEREERLPPGFK